MKLLSSMAMRELLAEIAARFARETTRAVVCEAAGGVDVARRVQAGEAVDVVVLAANAIDKLIADGRLIPGSRYDLAKSGIAVAVRHGMQAPDIGTEEAVKAAVLAARTVSFSTGPSGVYLEKMFERWGILDALRARIVVPPPGVPVGTLVAAGSVELGFQQLSELMSLPGIDVLGPLPPGIQTLTLFSGGIAAISGRQDEARMLLEYLAAPAAAAVKRQHGMEPA